MRLNIVMYLTPIEKERLRIMPVESTEAAVFLAVLPAFPGLNGDGVRAK
jgi:hypothetical protein